jgi:diaminohydroxyphosphoribosylaminopyrimidine deaminase/5-amino-6-(5-phosphoribosylamino)uracil reductase
MARESIHFRHMRRALRLAKRGAGSVSPNPMVGAVVVSRGRIVGEGYHRRTGGPHAETDALSAAGGKARGGDLYVTLEPCCHHGRTPPCTDAVIRSGIRRVWVAIEDPNPVVNGKGVQALRDHGIRVETGILADEAARLNEFYLMYVRTGRPFVIGKTAMTLDGKIATRTGESRWISGERSRRVTHKLRRDVDAILVGVGTVAADDPELTERTGARPSKHPVRIVLDSSLRIPDNARVLEVSAGARTIVACTRTASKQRARALERRGVTVWSFSADATGRVNLRAVIRRVGREGLTSLLIEGGSEVMASALRSRVVDKMWVFLAPRILGGGAREAVGDLGITRLDRAVSLYGVRWRRVGEDLLVEGYPYSRKGNRECLPDWLRKSESLRP